MSKEFRKISEIRRMREIKGMSVEQLAEAVGVTKPTVYAWENGTCPRMHEMPKLSKVLQMSAVQIFYQYYLAEVDRQKEETK